MVNEGEREFELAAMKLSIVEPPKATLVSGWWWAVAQSLPPYRDINERQHSSERGREQPRLAQADPVCTFFLEAAV